MAVQEPPDWNSIRLFAIAFTFSAFAGLAVLLRSDKPVTPRSIFTHMLYSGLIGLCVMFGWFLKYKDDPYFLMALVIASGFGAFGIHQIVCALLKGRGIGIDIKMNSDDSTSKIPKKPPSWKADDVSSKK